MGGVSKPIRVVYYDDEEGMFRMDREAVSILKHLKGPIGVVSVCGAAQHGKSYIANQLVGMSTSGGFKVEQIHFPDQCTKGLWMGIAPSKETDEYSMLVLDTQGFGRNEEMEVKYFCLAVVLSSVVIYNQRGHMGVSAVSGYLSVVPKMADMINFGAELQQFSPILVCLLRDFYLNFGNSTPNQYMEYCFKLLDTVDYHVDCANEMNKVTNSIKAVFPERHCFPLGLPLPLLRDLGLTHRETPVDEFEKKVDELRSFLIEKSKPRKIGSKVMTGPIFVQITKYIVDAFNSRKRPTIASIWENVEKTKRPKSLKSATAATLVGNPRSANTRSRKFATSPPAANTQKRKRSIEQCMSSR